MFMPGGLRRRWADTRANRGGRGQPSAAGALLALLLAALAAPAAADGIRLALPLQCRPGIDCWVVNYLDRDPGPGRKDYRCGAMSYDGHNGTDIAIRDLKAMRDGVPVLAAADGVVRAVRDEMEDVNFRDTAADAIAKRECGNGVVVDHADGWQTQYCHMRRGSIRVKPRERVASGQPIGLVGLSGKTEFPHVHITVRRNGKILDPFVGEQDGPECQIGRAPLWKPEVLAALPYKAGAVHIAGIAPGRPDIQKARAGELRETTAGRDAEALVVWAEVYNVVTGDVLLLRLFAPDGKMILDAPQRIEKEQARVFRSAGRKQPSGGWPAGIYRAEVTYQRDGKALSDPVKTEIQVR